MRTLTKRFSCLLMAALFLFLAACASQSPSWQEQYDLGVRYLSEGNYQEAIVAFEAAIKIDPRRGEAYLGLAEACLKSGDPQRAWQVLNGALEAVQDPDMVQEVLDQWSSEGLLPADGFPDGAQDAGKDPEAPLDGGGEDPGSDAAGSDNTIKPVPTPAPEYPSEVNGWLERICQAMEAQDPQAFENMELLEDVLLENAGQTAISCASQVLGSTDPMDLASGTDFLYGDMEAGKGLWLHCEMEPGIYSDWGGEMEIDGYFLFELYYGHWQGGMLEGEGQFATVARYADMGYADGLLRHLCLQQGEFSQGIWNGTYHKIDRILTESGAPHSEEIAVGNAENGCYQGEFHLEFNRWYPEEELVSYDVAFDKGISDQFPGQEYTHLIPFQFLLFADAQQGGMDP